MSDQTVFELIKLGRECANELVSSALFVEQELAAFELPETQRSIVADVCSSLAFTSYRVIRELDRLPLLNAYDGGAAVTCVEVIFRIFLEELRGLRAAKKTLEADAGDDLACRLLADAEAKVIARLSALRWVAKRYSAAIRD